MNNYGLARRYPGAGRELDRYTKQELVRDTSQIAGIGDTARVALDEMTVTYVTANQLVAQALTAARYQSQNVPQTEMSQAYQQTQTQHFLQRMLMLQNIANDQILRYLQTSQRR